MNRRDQWEATVALAMLPVGGTLAILSALAFLPFLGSALVTAFWDRSWFWSCLWCVAGAALSVFNTARTIETMSSFEWRTLRPTLALTAILIATCPIWW